MIESSSVEIVSSFIWGEMILLRAMLQSISVIAVIMTALSGCMFGPGTGEKVYELLEKSAKTEQTFVKLQQQLTDKETKEEQLYEKIINLDMNHFEQMVSMSKEAKQLAADRENLIKQERDVIDKAYEQFREIVPLVKNAKDEQLKAKGEAMIETMQHRHDAFSDLTEIYLRSVKLDRELYDMLQKKETEQSALKKQVAEINEAYKQILSKNKDFNAYTKKYNKLKKAFYEQAGLDVKYEQGE
ncbi:MAG TPA: YkyA family protein [Bacillales bacterium]|nr:YkyA family protein [Bacillales bacterium]